MGYMLIGSSRINDHSLRRQYVLHLLMDSMIKIAHSPDEDLRTLQHALPGGSPDIQANEPAMRIVKIGMLDGFPDVMHLFRRERNLFISRLSPRKIKEHTIFGYDHMKVNDTVPGGLPT